MNAGVDDQCIALARKATGRRCRNQGTRRVEGGLVCPNHQMHGYVPCAGTVDQIGDEQRARMARVAEGDVDEKESETKWGDRKKLAHTRTEGITLHFVITTRREVPGGVPLLDEVDGYVTTGLYEDGRLGEIFIRIGKPGSSEALFDHWAIAFSVALQHGASVDELCAKFIGTRFEPSGATNLREIPRCTSPVDLICRWLRLKYGVGGG